MFLDEKNDRTEREVEGTGEGRDRGDENKVKKDAKTVYSDSAGVAGASRAS